MSDSIILVCEGPSDQPVVEGLIKRLLMAKFEWLHGLPNEALPRLHGLREGEGYLRWASVKTEVAAAHSQGKQGDAFRVFDMRLGRQGPMTTPDAAIADSALRLIRYYLPEARAIILQRDADNQPERRKGLEEARARHPGVVVCIGFADPKIEAWILAGFEAKTEGEHQQIKDLHEATGVHPIREAHRLREPKEGHSRNIKHVLRELTGSFERQRLCWEEASFEVLHTHGKQTGLSEFLSELETHLVPAFQRP